MKRTREKIDNLTIKWKLFAYFAAFVTIILVILWVFQIVFLNDFYRNIKIATLKNTAIKVAENINNPDLQPILTDISREDDISIIVGDASGTIKCSSHVLAESIIRNISFLQYNTIYNATKDKGGTYFEILDDKHTISNVYGERIYEERNSKNRSVMIYTKLVKTFDGKDEMILLNSIITPVDSTVSTLRVQLIYITIIMIILALILAFWISRRVSKPIANINKSAKLLAKGEYEVEFEGLGYREIIELKDTLNYAAKELSKVENLRRELIANISHDLRTPLTMISGYSEVMRDIPNENTPENVQVIIDETRRLTTLVNDVLDMSKFESGQQILNLTRFNLTEVIRQTLKRYSKLIGKDGYELKFFYNEDVFVVADEVRLSQVIYNLLNNAITYTGEDKKVTINQIVNEQTIRIEIADTGDGIEPDKLENIWDRYYKISGNHKRAQVGTGLGLSIVKSVLDMHKASYGVRSELSVGSTFWFELPSGVGRDNYSAMSVGL